MYDAYNYYFIPLLIVHGICDLYNAHPYIGQVGSPTMLNIQDVYTMHIITTMMYDAYNYYFIPLLIVHGICDLYNAHPYIGQVGSPTMLNIQDVYTMHISSIFGDQL